MSENAALKCGCFSGQIAVGKALSCAVSVVKAGDVQDGAATSCVQKEISAFYGYERAFFANRFVTFLFECKF